MIEKIANARYVAGAQRAICSVILDRQSSDPFGFGKKALQEVKKNAPLLWLDILDMIEQAGFNHWNRYLEEQSEDVFFVKPPVDRWQRQKQRKFLENALKKLDRIW